MSGYTLEICTDVNATVSLYFEHKSFWLGFWSGAGSVFLSDDWRSAEKQASGWWQQNREELNSIAQECWNGSIPWISAVFVFFALGVNGNVEATCMSLDNWSIISKCLFFFLLHDSCAGWLSVSDTFTSSSTAPQWSLFYTLNLGTILFFTHCKLWHDSLMYSPHQQHNMGIDRLDSYGDDVLI